MINETNQVKSETARRSAVITGASGDMGRSLCQVFLEDGYIVYAADLRPQDAQERLVPVRLDVTDRAAVFALAARVAEESRPSVWVNAAGILVACAVADATEADWDRVIDINLKGTFHGCAAALKTLGDEGGGRIINIGSISGQIGGGGVHPAYGASKAGVHSLTKTYATEGAKKNVLCNAVAPGVLQGSMIKSFKDEQLERLTRTHPLRRHGTMEEVAAVVRFLAGPASSYMNGVIVSVNGGVFMP